MKLNFFLILFVGTAFFICPSTFGCLATAEQIVPISENTYVQSSILEQDEVTVLLEIIETSKKNLEEQKKLLKDVVEFKKAREAFLTDPNSGKLATSLVKTASRVHEEIEKNHLAQLFSQDFLTEIQFFTQVGQKQGVKR